MKKLLALIAAFGLLMSLSAPTAYAADRATTCYNNGWNPRTLAELFPASELWYPGKTKSWNLAITNQSGMNQDISSSALNISTINNLDRVIYLTIFDTNTSTTVWTGLLRTYYVNSNILLIANMPNNSTRVLRFTGYMDIKADNRFMNGMTKFDLQIGCNVDNQPTPTPSRGKTSDMSVSCTDSNFDAIVQLKENNIPRGNVQVRFTYRGNVQYATTGNDGYARTGYNFSVEDDVRIEPGDGFPSGNIRIRQSDCRQSPTATPGPGPTTIISSTTSTPFPTRSFDLLGGVFGLFSGEEEPTPEVSSEQTKNPTTAPKPTGQVQGTTTVCGCLWWPVLVLQAIAQFIYFFLFVKDIEDKEKRNRHNLIGTIMVVLSYIIFLIINPCIKTVWFIFTDSTSFFCKYYFFISVLVLVIIYALRKFSNKREESRVFEQEADTMSSTENSHS